MNDSKSSILNDFLLKLPDDMIGLFSDFKFLITKIKLLQLKFSEKDVVNQIENIISDLINESKVLCNTKLPTMSINSDKLFFNSSLTFSQIIDIGRLVYDTKLSISPTMQLFKYMKPLPIKNCRTIQTWELKIKKVKSNIKILTDLREKVLVHKENHLQINSIQDIDALLDDIDVQFQNLQTALKYIEKQILIMEEGKEGGKEVDNTMIPKGGINKFHRLTIDLDNVQITPYLKERKVEEQVVAHNNNYQEKIKKRNALWNRLVIGIKSTNRPTYSLGLYELIKEKEEEYLLRSDLITPCTNSNTTTSRDYTQKIAWRQATAHYRHKQGLIQTTKDDDILGLAQEGGHKAASSLAATLHIQANEVKDIASKAVEGFISAMKQQKQHTSSTNKMILVLFPTEQGNRLGDWRHIAGCIEATNETETIPTPTSEEQLIVSDKYESPIKDAMKYMRECEMKEEKRLALLHSSAVAESKSTAFNMQMNLKSDLNLSTKNEALIHTLTTSKTKHNSTIVNNSSMKKDNKGCKSVFSIDTSLSENLDSTTTSSGKATVATTSDTNNKVSSFALKDLNATIKTTDTTSTSKISNQKESELHNIPHPKSSVDIITEKDKGKVGGTIIESTADTSIIKDLKAKGVEEESPSAISVVQKRVHEIYSQYNPVKLSEISTLLEKYKGREQELIKNLEKKYNVPPSTTSITSSTGTSYNIISSSSKSNITNTLSSNSLFSTNNTATSASSSVTNSLFVKNTNTSSFTPTPFSIHSPSSNINNIINTTEASTVSNTLFAKSTANSIFDIKKDSIVILQSGDSIASATQKRVHEIYFQFNPAKLSEIPTLLEKYKGREQELIRNLEKKYNVPPSITSSTTPTMTSNLFKASPTANTLFSTKNTTTIASSSATNSLFAKNTNISSFTPTPFSIHSPSSSNSMNNTVASTNTLFAKSTVNPPLANTCGSLFSNQTQQQSNISINNSSSSTYKTPSLLLFNTSSSSPVVGQSLLNSNTNIPGGTSPFSSGFSTPINKSSNGINTITTPNIQSSSIMIANNGTNMNTQSTITSASPFSQLQSQSSGTSSLFGSKLLYNTNTTSVMNSDDVFTNNNSNMISSNNIMLSMFSNNNNDSSVLIVQKRVHEIYSQYNPAKLSEIQTLLEKYKGREQELIKNLEKKYSVPPSITSSTGTFGQNNLFSSNTNITNSSGFGTASTANSLFNREASSRTTPTTTTSPFGSSALVQNNYNNNTIAASSNNMINYNSGFGSTTTLGNTNRPATSLFGNNNSISSSYNNQNVGLFGSNTTTQQIDGMSGLNNFHMLG